jgi:hypothetical protein
VNRDGGTASGNGGFRVGLWEHGLMKADGRISIKDYYRSERRSPAFI